MTDTIFALSSGRPPAAIAVIRVSGPQAHEAAAAIAGSLPEPRQAALRELRDPRTGEIVDQAIVVRFDAPASATGENTVEFQCHGGRAVVDALLDALHSLDGLREARPGEFTRSAFENGRIDLTAAEGLADLLEAETQSQRKAALALAEGGLSKEVTIWQQRVLALSAIAERAIDYDEDDARLDPALSAGCRALALELDGWLERPRVEPLRDGVRVVVAGPPNAGKSSLVNALTGSDRAIVTAVPGTTRDQIDVPLALGGVPIILTDTAGLRDTGDEVEAIGVARAGALMGSADILVWLGESGESPGHPRCILIHGKSDLRAAPPPGSLAVSSVTGSGLAALLERIAAEARAFLPGEGALALNRRQAQHIAQAQSALTRAGAASDVVLVAEELREARLAFDQLTGRAGVEEVLDALFGRFCLGK